MIYLIMLVWLMMGTGLIWHMKGIFTMRVNRNEYFAAFGFVAALALGLLLAAWAAGCNHGSNIPIDPEPTCVELVTDECVPEVIAEFCTEPEVCVPEIVEVEVPNTDVCVLEGDLCWRGSYINGNWKYVQVECDIQPTVCPEPFTCDDYPDDTPRGHLPKECRGRSVK